MTIVIAEAGVNHNGSEALARQLVDAAHQAGADIVKFQTFKAKNLVTKTARQAEYQIENTGIVESQYEMLKRLELSLEAHHRLQDYCNELGIKFLSTAFDLESLDFLVNEMQLKTLKIPSGEITNAPLVLAHARTGCDLIVSTGMATEDEIEAALGVIAFGFLHDRSEKPTEIAFAETYRSPQGQKVLQEKVTLLHCTTEYPAPLDEINLNAMETMALKFDLRVGYSDHSAGIVVPIAATAKGAVLIEKHFTLDKNMEGPDHKASLDPIELAEMIQGIKAVGQALGSPKKTPTPSELKNRDIARKSIVAACNIEKGESFSEDNLAIMRPGNGMSPSHYWRLLGEGATRSYGEGDLIHE